MMAKPHAPARAACLLMVGMLAAGVATSCGTKVNDTLLVVRVGLRDLTPGLDVDRIDVTATPARGKGATRSFPVGSDTALPIELAVVPTGTSPGFDVEVTASATKGGQPVVSVTAGLAFSANEARQVLLLLEKSCAAIAPTACSGGQTCRGGACVPTDVFRSDVVAYVPGRVDAAAPGGGGEAGAGGQDAAVPHDASRDGTVARDASSPPLPGAWTAIETKIPLTVTLTGVWPIAPDDVVMVGYDVAGAIGRAYRWNGQRVEPWPLPLATPPLYGVWASRSDDVWVVGAGGTILHGGSGLQALSRVQVPTDADLASVFGFSRGQVAAAGARGTLLQRTDPSWMVVPAPAIGTTNVYGLGGTGVADLWAVGAGGGVFRGTGSSWMRLDHMITANVLYSVWAISTDDVWIAGERIALHWNGQQLTRSQLALEAGVSTWGASANDVWAVGRAQAGGSSIARFDGTSWNAFPSPFNGSLQSVRGSSARDVWAVGNMGTVLRFAPSP